MIFIGIVVLMFMGFLPNPIFPYESPTPKMENPEIVITPLSTWDGMNIMEEITTNDFSLDVDDIEDLNPNFYGLTNTNTGEVINWYENQLESEGWSLIFNEEKTGVSGEGENAMFWSYKIKGFMKGFMGQLIMTYGGDTVTNATNYDVILLTTSSAVSTYYSLFEKMEMIE